MQGEPDLAKSEGADTDSGIYSFAFSVNHFR